MAQYTVGRANRSYKLLRQNSIDVSGPTVLLSNEMPGERRFRRTGSAVFLCIRL